MTTYQGIDYGMGKTNIDHKTGIRYGVIPHGEVGQAWFEDSEPDYGLATCPKCGNQAWDFDDLDHMEANGRIYTLDDIDEFERAEHECDDYFCLDCEYVFGSESAFPEEVFAFTYESDGYKCSQSGDDTDIFIELSPYFTYAQFCSPCAPGAVYLLNPLDTPVDGNKGYCFGHGWFESGKAPYPVYSVETGELVKPE